MLYQAMLIFKLVELEPLSFGKQVLPDWSQDVGWLITVASIAMIPIFAVYQFFTLSRQPQYSQLSFLPVGLMMTMKTLKSTNLLDCLIDWFGWLIK